MNKDKFPIPMPTVLNCIAYMTTLNWKLIRQKRSYYLFRNDRMKEQFNNPLAFTLGELRDAFKNGF